MRYSYHYPYPSPFNIADIVMHTPLLEELIVDIPDLGAQDLSNAEGRIIDMPRLKQLDVLVSDALTTLRLMAAMTLPSSCTVHTAKYQCIDLGDHATRKNLYSFLSFPKPIRSLHIATRPSTPPSQDGEQTTLIDLTISDLSAPISMPFEARTHTVLGPSCPDSEGNDRQEETCSIPVDLLSSLFKDLQFHHSESLDDLEILQIEPAVSFHATIRDIQTLPNLHIIVLGDEHAKEMVETLVKELASPWQWIPAFPIL
ncbi:hypothetical protein V5O48_002368, partial [Marasmius crinis-equi]